MLDEKYNEVKTIKDEILALGEKLCHKEEILEQRIMA